MSEQRSQPRGHLRRVLMGQSTKTWLVLLVRELCTRAAAFLSRDADAVGPEQSWVDLGFDSLRAVDFRSELEVALDLSLRSTLLFDQPSANALAAYLIEQLPKPTSAASSAAATRPSATGADDEQAKRTAADFDQAGSKREAIAIVGAACRFPGGDGLDAFWQLLERGGDAVVPIGKDRFDIDALYDPDPNADGKLYVREAGMLDDLAGFDAALFGISPREATMLDPQQRLLLETSWHALEHAGTPPDTLQQRDACVGVYIGTRASEYFDSQCDRTPEDATGYYPTGNAISTAAGRISFTFGFRGPCYALDTACSGSLVAVHNAARALRAGDCDVALAGGVNAIIDPVPMAGLCRARMLAPDGRCKSFDERADGYGRGEGCGIVVLKRLVDAQRDGDRVLAVIAGTASNQDGRSGGLTVPHGPSQSAVIRAALEDAGLQPDDIDYIEAHGTGTALGDPIEIAALDEVFADRTRKLPVGSVKTNIGHLEAAAGISGLLKALLALQHRELPATIHGGQPSSHIDWQNSIVDIVRSRTTLPDKQTTHTAGISSFGFSGTNCHVILASVPAAATTLVPAQTSEASGERDHLLGIQAATANALRALAQRHATQLEHGVPSAALGNYCRAAAATRSELPHRAAFVASSSLEMANALVKFAAGEHDAAAAHATAPALPPRIAFLFPGQGSQAVGMGQELAALEPVFGNTLDAAAQRLANAGLPTPLTELMWHGDGAQLRQTHVTQPVLCAYQLAMLALLRSVGITPDAVLGHSVGDYAAAVAAGTLDGQDALSLCAARGRLMAEHCETGAMLSVLAPREQWQHRLQQHPSLSVAVHNAPANHAVGGPVKAVDALQQELEAAGVPVRRLAVSHAFHTAATDPMLSPFAAQFGGVRMRVPERAFLDCRTGLPAGDELTTPEHWVQHVRQPVDFAGGVQGLAELGCELWIELGTSGMLGALAMQNGVESSKVVALQRGKQAARKSWLDALAMLWTRGVSVDLEAGNRGLGADRTTPHIPLPNYPFDRQHFWLQHKRRAVLAGNVFQHNVLQHNAKRHPLLGARQNSSMLRSNQALFSQQIASDSPAWLADHVAFGQILFPAAAMLECALAAEYELGQRLPVRVFDAALRAPLLVADEPTRLECLTDERPSGRAFTLQSLADADGSWTLHLEAKTGATATPTSTTDLAALDRRFEQAIEPAELYARCHKAQLQYGKLFRGVQRIRVHEGEALADVCLPDEMAATGTVLHPALLDACFHTLFAVLPPDTATYLPIGIEELIVVRPGLRRITCHTRIRRATGTSRSADLDLYDEHGDLCATVSGLQLVPTDIATVRAATSRQKDLLYHIAWDNAQPGRELVTAKGVAIVGDPRLAQELEARLPIGSAHACTIDELASVLLRYRIDRVLLLSTACQELASDTLTVQQQLFGDAVRAAQLATQAPGPPQLCFVTHGVQNAGITPAGSLPHAATLVGLRRTLSAEHPSLAASSIDLDPAIPAANVTEHAAQLLREWQRPTNEPEVALRGELRRIPRLRRGSLPRAALAPPDGPYRLRARSYGQFDYLQLQPLQRTTPAQGQVEVAMHAAALNFKDALHVLGMLREHAEQRGIQRADQQPLGFEGSGTIVSVGQGVSDFSVGDRVAVSASSCLQSHVTADAARCVRVPQGIELIAAAGVTTVFATVLYALRDLATVQRGETVLVHAAAGGVGQAAIQYLQYLGCRVLATASPGKRDLVMRLGAEVVGSSRTADFAAGVHAATNGEGVDVVLNTLSGESVAVSFSVLQQGGRFVELGKLGVWSQQQAHENRPDVAFYAFDLGDEFVRDPLLQPRLLQDIVAHLRNQTLRPVQTTIAPLADAREAFQYLAQGRHVGKVVLQLPRTSEGRNDKQLRDDRTYLITGAGGGIAPAIATSLVQAGARSLALLARRAIPAGTRDQIEQLGATVYELHADCCDRAEMLTALEQLRATAPAIGGVVHAAGSLADGMIAGLSWQQAQVALLPKVQGSVLLDELLRDDPLDFFVLLSSMAGTLGNPGQGAYAAANAFVDAFANWRRLNGKPTTALAYGPWHGDGMAGRLDDALRARLQAIGVDFVSADIGAAILRDHRDHSRNVTAMAVRWHDWLARYGERTPPLLAELGLGEFGTEQQHAATAAQALDLASMPPAERPQKLRDAVLEQIARVLGFTGKDQIDADRTFQDQGMDSLMAVDAKDRLEAMLSVTLPATALFDHPDLMRLVPHLLALACPDEPDGDGLDDLETEDLAQLLKDELGADDGRDAEGNS